MDSGGGGPKWALARALSARNITHRHCLASNYVFHTLQTYLRNEVQHVLGEGGMDEKGNYSMNCIHTLHRVYIIQNWQENDELKELWT